MNFFKNIEKWNRERRKKKKQAFVSEKSQKLIVNLFKAFESYKGDIPVFIISYNNGVYVENMVNQLNNKGIKPIVIDNASKSEDTIDVLKRMEAADKCFVAFSDYNFGHLVGLINPIYDIMPEVFAYNDPDLQLNEKLNENFLEELLDIALKYNVYKAGFALNINLDKNMIGQKYYVKKEHPFRFNNEFNVKEWEERFWKYRLDDDNYELYYAPIDTTFAVYVKSNYDGEYINAIRVAGDFTAIHLPWYPELDLFDKAQKSEYLKENKSSTWI